MIWFFILFQGIIFGIASSYLAGQKNKDQLTWFVIGFLLGFIGLFMIAFSKDESQYYHQSVNRNQFDNHLDSIDDSNVGRNLENNNSGNDEQKFTKYNLINPHCPIEIVSYSSLENSLNIRLTNYSEKELLGLKLRIEGFNSFEDSVGIISDVVIQDFKRGQNQEGEVLNINGATRYIIEVTEIVFTDKSRWVDGDNNYLKKPNDNLTDVERSYFKYILFNNPIIYPHIDHDIWLCVCGNYQLASNERCRNCGNDRVITLMLSNFDSLKKFYREKLSNEGLNNVKLSSDYSLKTNYNEFMKYQSNKNIDINSLEELISYDRYKAQYSNEYNKLIIDKIFNGCFGDFINIKQTQEENEDRIVNLYRQYDLGYDELKSIPYFNEMMKKFKRHYSIRKDVMKKYYQKKIASFTLLGVIVASLIFLYVTYKF